MIKEIHAIIVRELGSGQGGQEKLQKSMMGWVGGLSIYFGIFLTILGNCFYEKLGLFLAIHTTFGIFLL